MTDLFASDTLSAARELVEADSVFVVAQDRQGTHRRIEAVVASGEPGRWYERAVIDTEDDDAELEATCTCGAAPGCAHTAAALLSASGAVPGLVPGHRRAEEPPQVEIGSSETAGDWFDVHVRVTVEGEEVDFAALFTALARGEDHFLLPSGIWFPLHTEELQGLRGIIEEARELADPQASSLRVNRYQADLWQELSELGIVRAQQHQWWEKIAQLTGSQPLHSQDPPTNVHAQLRDYQRDGYSWLRFLHENALGGVLADDMGLGKTLQTLAMIQDARNQDRDAGRERPPFLIVAPTSVVTNWQAEARRFTPELDVVVISSTGARREAALDQEIAGADVVITSYALFRMEGEQYQQLDWSGLILDEAQMIKNHRSRGYRVARTLQVPFKLIITGTPMENNLTELWALVSLACPGLLGGREHFSEVFAKPIQKHNDGAKLDLLRRRLRPFLLRRTKDLVATELPQKQEQVLQLDLHPEHRRLYDRRLQRERQKILGLVDNVKVHRFEIFRSLTLLRQLALDAELAGEGSAPSAKLDALGELLERVTAEGHKVLVLSQFTRFLTKALRTAQRHGIDCSYLDGTTVDRQSVIEAFQAGDTDVFFISLKAGGFGLNLTEADYVVLLDPWWNPAAETQAIDRAHRIGQTKNVMVYRLVSAGTIESKVMALKETKHELFDRVLDGGAAAQSTALTAEDIRELIQ